MNLFLRYSLLLCFLCMSFSCKTEHKLVKSKQNDLLNTDIEKVVSTLEENIRPTNNSKYYHFKIKSKFNDSTFVVDLVKNTQLPIVSDSVVRVIKYKDSYIFIYDKNKKISSKELSRLKKEQLISNGTNSPFFIPDTKYWNLLIEKKNVELIVKEMRLLLERDKNSKEDNLIDF